MKKRLLLLLNPYAGQRRANRFLPEIIRMYLDRDYEVIPYVTACQGDATQFLEKNADSYDHIVCIGGDGTLNETVRGLAASGCVCPVGYIPAGTTNDYANSLGLSDDILQAAKDAVDGEIHQFDMGYFNNRTFVYTASCGAFTKASYTTPQYVKNVLGHAAYILEGIRDLPNIRPIPVKLESENKTVEGEYLFCSITNSLSIGGILRLDPEQVRLNDGEFEVMLIREPSNPIEWSELLSSLSLKTFPNAQIDFFTASNIRITTETDVEWTLDGERGEAGRYFEIHNLHKRLQMILPEGTDISGQDAENASVKTL